MFSNYPLVVQILGWGVFMGLNAYVGACCPLLNLAVLAFVGSYASKKTGIVLLVIAFIITAAELVWGGNGTYSGTCSLFYRARLRNFESCYSRYSIFCFARQIRSIIPNP